MLTTTVTQVRQGDRHRAQGQQRANLGDDERLQQVAEDVSVEHDHGSAVVLMRFLPIRERELTSRRGA